MAIVVLINGFMIDISIYIYLICIDFFKCIVNIYDRYIYDI